MGKMDLWTGVGARGRVNWGMVLGAARILVGGGVGQWRELSGSWCKKEWNGAAGASAVFMGQRKARAARVRQRRRAASGGEGRCSSGGDRHSSALRRRSVGQWSKEES